MNTGVTASCTRAVTAEEAAGGQRPGQQSHIAATLCPPCMGQALGDLEPFRVYPPIPPGLREGGHYSGFMRLTVSTGISAVRSSGCAPRI